MSRDDNDDEDLEAFDWDASRPSFPVRKATDPGLSERERKEIVLECLAAGGHFVTFDPTTPNQYGRCIRCNTWVGNH